MRSCSGFGTSEAPKVESDNQSYRSTCPGCIELNEKYEKLLGEYNALLEVKAGKKKKPVSWRWYKKANIGWFYPTFEHQVVIWFDEYQQPIRLDFKSQRLSDVYSNYMTLVRHGDDNKWFCNETGKCYDVLLDSANDKYLNRARAILGIKFGSYKKCKVRIDTNRNWIMTLDGHQMLEYW